ncbi:nuclear transport factor 2-like protein [Microlunatus flavus]|uniref:SnoaL-like domain-containing protein n=1 Tax=Microlunatus flavus TaxID=1036181 RepID=A0A1H9BYX6_9ACTN|nr:hypothetical protein [Microlunatus flavus]SEP93967.1 hypothetical protein SAMN05421756_1024 [Microlunatus flavus]
METLRSLSVVGDEAVAVDSVVAYTGPDGSRSVVSSCDVYELDAGSVVRITSYNVELDDAAVAGVVAGS